MNQQRIDRCLFGRECRSGEYADDGIACRQLAAHGRRNDVLNRCRLEKDIHCSLATDRPERVGQSLPRQIEVVARLGECNLRRECTDDADSEESPYPVRARSG